MVGLPVVPISLKGYLVFKNYLKHVIQKLKSIISEIDGEVSNIIDNAGRMEVVVSNDLETRSYLTPYGAKLRVNVGDEVRIGDKNH